MSTKSVVLGFVMVVVSTIGCGATSDGDEPDEVYGFEEASSSEVSSALSPSDDMPAPFAPRVPSWEPRLTRPIWDIQPFVDDAEQPRFGHCYMYWLKLLVPGGSFQEVPITVCP